MISYPFESKNTGTASLPIWDRAITAEMERNFNKLRYTNGVFATPPTGLMVVANTGMKVKVNPGGAHIDGCMAYESNFRDITLSAASQTLNRIDRIVCRLDTADDKRNVEIYVKEGVPATTPSPLDIVKQSNYYELVLADIRIPKGATSITNGYIIDQRLNTSLCGLVVPAIPNENQTAGLWKQIEESIALVNSTLDGTTLGKLQNQITALRNDLNTCNSARIKAQIGVGGIYLSESNANPSTSLGYGTWVQFGQGRTLIGVGTSDQTYTAGETGGQSPPTMPAHSHTLTGNRPNGSYTVANRPWGDPTSAGGSSPTWNTATCDAVGDVNKGNMPPYIAVYMWKRTA